MDINSLIKNKEKAFAEICRSHDVDTLYAFGSSITLNFNEKSSDIEVIVQLAIKDPADRGEALLSLWNQLELFLERKVDLLTEDSLKNPYLKANINRTKKLIYDREREQVFI
jgi:hypothetical protein